MLVSNWQVYKKYDMAWRKAAFHQLTIHYGFEDHHVLTIFACASA